MVHTTVAALAALGLNAHASAPDASGLPCWADAHGVRAVRVLFLPEHGVDFTYAKHYGDMPLPAALDLLRAKHAELAWPGEEEYYGDRQAAGLAAINALAAGAPAALVPVEFGVLLAW
jgi:hypothetical protein